VSGTIQPRPATRRTPLASLMLPPSRSEHLDGALSLCGLKCEHFCRKFDARLLPLNCEYVVGKANSVGVLPLIEGGKIEGVAVELRGHAPIDHALSRYPPRPRPNQVGRWLNDARETGLYGIKRFVSILQRDIDAVRNAGERDMEQWPNRTCHFNALARGCLVRMQAIPPMKSGH
jgi:hypothetical protein